MEAVARYFARELALDADQETVLLFGLRLTMNLIAGVAAVTVLGLVLGSIWTTLFAYTVSGSMKIFAGGAHSRSSRNCVLVGTLYFVSAGWCADRFGPSLGSMPAAAAGLLTFAFVLIALRAYAPVEPAEKPLASPEHRRAMRAAAFRSLWFWSGVIFILGSAGWGHAAAPGPWRALFLGGLAGWAWLALNLSPAGDRLAAMVDHVLCFPEGRCRHRDVEEESVGHRGDGSEQGGGPERGDDFCCGVLPAAHPSVAQAVESP